MVWMEVVQKEGEKKDRGKKDRSRGGKVCGEGEGECGGGRGWCKRKGMGMTGGSGGRRRWEGYNGEGRGW